MECDAFGHVRAHLCGVAVSLVQATERSTLTLRFQTAADRRYLVDCAFSADRAYTSRYGAITVEMDIESPNPSRVCGDVDGEIIRYAYDAANSRITRENIRCPGGQNAANEMPFLGPIAGQPEVRTVEVVNNALPVFRYFDGTGAEIPHANLPNDIPRIRRIEIALLVRSADVDPTSGQRRQMAYSTSIIPRNHGIQF